MSRSFFYITAGSMEEAEKLAAVLVEERLAACANIFPKIKSFFYWQGEAQSEEEVLLVGKTKSSLVDELVEAVKKHHSYELPCVITWEIGGGNPPFLEWIDAETR